MYLFFGPPASSPLPHLRTALSTTLPPLNLNLTLTPCSHAQFSSSSRASSSHLTSPAPFGHPSRLTEAAIAAAALREQLEQAGHFQFPATSDAIGFRQQPPGEPATATGLSVRPRRRSGPPAAAVSAVQPQVQPTAPPGPVSNSPTRIQPAAAAGPATPPPAQVAPAVVPSQVIKHSPPTRTTPHSRPFPLTESHRRTTSASRELSREWHVVVEPNSPPSLTRLRGVSCAGREDTPASEARVCECACCSVISGPEA